MSNPHNLKIRDDYRDFLPPLEHDVALGLEKSLVESGGATDPIIARKDTREIIDGYNRFEICERLGLPYDVKFLGMTEDADILSWMIRRQLNRRNLRPSGGRVMLVGKLWEAEGKRKVPIEGVTQGEWVIQQIADALKIKSSTAYTLYDLYKRLPKLIPSIRDRYITDKTSLTVEQVRTLSAMSDDEQNEFYLRYESGEKPGQILASMGKLETKAVKQSDEPQPLDENCAHCAHQGEEVNLWWIWDDGVKVCYECGNHYGEPLLTEDDELPEESPEESPEMPAPDYEYVPEEPPMYDGTYSTSEPTNWQEMAETAAVAAGIKTADFPTAGKSESNGKPLNGKPLKKSGKTPIGDALALLGKLTQCVEKIVSERGETTRSKKICGLLDKLVLEVRDWHHKK